MDSVVVMNYRALEVEVTHRSGVMADVNLDDLNFRTVSAFCTHPDVEVALYYSGREPGDGLSAVIHCPICGYFESPATLLQTPAQLVKRTDKSDLIFGESDHGYYMSSRAFSRGAARRRH